MTRRTRKSRRIAAAKGASAPKIASRSGGTRRMAIAGAVGLAVVGSIAVILYHGAGEDDTQSASVVVPTLSSAARQGETIFLNSCARCHGQNGSGTRQGPPLVHKIYEPSHHGDAAIRRAVREGVRPHHWPFGPMPPIDITDQQVSSVITYVREVQSANGIL